MQQIWDLWSPHVGRINLDEEMLATGWRLPGSANLVVTAGHVLAALLPPRTRCDWTGGRLVAGAQISFSADGNLAEGLAILDCALVHPRWDLALLRIAPGAIPSSPPNLAPRPDLLVPGRQIAILGYPGSKDGTVFQTAGIRHLSVGEIARRSALSLAVAESADPDATLRLHYGSPADALAAHDASTLPGYSGAPVIDIKTGALLGIHVWGSAEIGEIVQRQDWNDLVDLWAVTREGWLAAGLSLADVPVPPPTAPLVDCSPIWQGGAFLAGGELNALQNLARRANFDSKDAQLFRGIGADRPDDRDRLYTPALQAPRDTVLPDPICRIGDQASSATCAAFAVAAAIEQQLPEQRRGSAGFAASVRMLDAMARDYDEFLDDTGEGTTLRAVLKGFFHNGVCREETMPYRNDAPFMLTRAAAAEARSITLGAYYRVAPSLTDMQMAVQETGAVVVSAHIHAGWQPRRPGRLREIAFDADNPAPVLGAHAFVVVGYDENGFILRNSWGKGWGRWQGRPGHAIWRYDDWAANVIDAWVLRLSPLTPAGFDRAGGELSLDGLGRPRRTALLGHMLQVERDWIVEHGALGLGRRAIAETAAFLAGPKALRHVPTLAFVFHDPLMDPELIARVAARMIPAMTSRRVYPLHISYGADELRTLALRLAADAEAVRLGFSLSETAPDSYLERRVALVAQRLIADYRIGAESAATGPLTEPIAALMATRSRKSARPPLVLAAGLGVIPALACCRAGAFGRNERKTALAAPVLIPDDWTELRLSPLDRPGRVPGYSGDLIDLLAMTLAEQATPRAPAPQDAGVWQTIEAALSDRSLIARICERA